jgi:hypothetical protein
MKTIESIFYPKKFTKIISFGSKYWSITVGTLYGNLSNYFSTILVIIQFLDYIYTIFFNNMNDIIIAISLTDI